MTSRIKTLAKRSLHRAGYYRLYARLNAPGEKRLLVLMYHDLVNDDAARNESPTRAQFEAHLRVLKRRYRVAALATVVDEIRSGEGLREDTVAITFDDGYPAVYSIAFPLLQKYDMPATIFLLTGWVDGEQVFWWQELGDMLRAADPSLLSAAAVALGIPAATTGAARQDIEGFLRALPDKERDRRMGALRGALFPSGDFTPREHPALSWQHVSEMANAGIEIAAHTRTHPNIKGADLAEVEQEILRSKTDIEERLQRPVVGFAYPYGKDTAAYRPVESILERHNFTYACTAVSGNNESTSNLYALFRGSLPLTTSAALIERELCLRFVRPNKVETVAVASG